MNREAFIRRFNDSADQLDKKLIRTTVRRSIERNVNEELAPGNYDLIIAIEELSELQKTLTKALRGIPDSMSVVEEMADVALALIRIQMIFGISTEDLYRAINAKNGRLKDVLDNGRKYK